MRVNSYGMKYAIKIDASIENGVGIIRTVSAGNTLDTSEL